MHKRFNVHFSFIHIQGNMNAMCHPNDVILSVLLPHIRFNRNMMLAKDNTPRHAARSTHVILVTNPRRTLQWPAQSMDLNPSKQVWDILKRNVHSRYDQISGSSHVLLVRCAIIIIILCSPIISLPSHVLNNNTLFGQRLNESTSKRFLSMLFACIQRIMHSHLQTYN